MAHARKVFINLPVENLDRSVAFFRKLGFEFNPQFTDKSATCMIVSDEAFVMLLTEKRFREFINRPLGDATRSTSVLLGVSASSREEVDQMVETAIESGGSPAADPRDHGFMYQRSFYDPDGHHWEVIWMDPSTVTG